MIEFAGQAGMAMVNLDQGPYGHARRKPTTLLTNLPEMETLENGKGGGHEELSGELQGRLRQSREWAAWAPGVVAAVKASLMVYLRNLNLMDHMKIKKAMNLDQWKEHVRRGHCPFDRRCRMRLQEAGVDHPHRRLKAAVSAYVLSVDITGPFVVGNDVGTNRKVRYALVATVAVPVKEEEEALPGEDRREGFEGDSERGDRAGEEDQAEEEIDLEELDCENQEPRVSDEVAEKVNAKVKDEIKDALRGYQVQNVTAVEVLESRRMCCSPWASCLRSIAAWESRSTACTATEPRSSSRCPSGSGVRSAI